MMVLVDTSVWVDHLVKGEPVLAKLLTDELVVVHSFIIGELACGNIKNRDEILLLLESLPHVTVANHEEVLKFITREKLYGLGLGYIDIHLLASTLLSNCKIWTRDNKLSVAANRFKTMFS